MQMRLGEALRITLRGSSHGPFVGAIVEGMPAGLLVDEEDVKAAMALRKTGGTYSSKRKEEDAVCLLYTSPSPRDRTRSRMPSSA